MQASRVRVGKSQRGVSSGMNISHQTSQPEASMARRRVIGRTGARIASASRSGYWMAKNDRKRQPSYFRNGSSPAGRTGRPSSWLDWVGGCYCCTMKRPSNAASICCSQQSRQGWMRFAAFQPRSNHPLRRLAPKMADKDSPAWSMWGLALGFAWELGSIMTKKAVHQNRFSGTHPTTNTSVMNVQCPLSFHNTKYTPNFYCN